MTQKFNKVAVPTLLMLVIVLIVSGATVLTPNEGSKTSSSTVTESEVLTESKTAPTVNEAANTVIPKTNPTVATVTTNPWHSYKNVCESFTVIEGTKRVRNQHDQLVYPTYHKRNRYRRRRSDQRRTAQLVRMVAAEMGADIPGAYMVGMMAHHEASYNSEAIHILNPDLEANKKAWIRHTYNRQLEEEIQYAMNLSSKRDDRDGYYRLKNQLFDIRRYQGNPHWRDMVQYTYRIPEHVYKDKTYKETEFQDSRSVWAFGYGLYGMNAVLFTHVWDREAPPWVLCGDEGIVATVTAIWALRQQQATCAQVVGTDGTNIQGMLWRWGHGQCGRGRLGPAWHKLMSEYAPKIAKRFVDKYAFTWDTVPDFGTKFPRYEMYRKGGKLRFRKDENGKKIPSDRVAIIEHMRAKAAKKGLLREEPLKLKHPGTEPVIVSRDRTVAVNN